MAGGNAHSAGTHECMAQRPQLGALLHLHR